jgi:hypothetical protein
MSGSFAIGLKKIEDKKYHDIKRAMLFRRMLMSSYIVLDIEDRILE